MSGQTRTNLARLLPDGRLDTGFIGSALGAVVSIALSTDGKVLVTGPFTMLSGISRAVIGRLHPDGSTDLSFNPGAGSPVNSVSIQADGGILVAGGFAVLGGKSCSGLGLLNNPTPVTQSLAYDGTNLTWLRAGGSPEIQRATLESSNDNTNWSSLPTPARLADRWVLTNISLTINQTVRARGFLASAGYQSGSGWFLESLLSIGQTPPQIVSNDPAFGTHSNFFRFNIHALPGQVVVIEATTDFLFWTPIQTNLTTSIGTILFTDSQSSLFPRRYYRVRLYQGLLPGPTILSGSTLGIQGGLFGFDLAAVPGQSVIIETSSNLTTWTALTTNSITNLPFHFLDAVPANLPLRFYRVRIP
jgi:hypothetical protein